MVRIFLYLTIGLSGLACEREPVRGACTALSSGALVVTELGDGSGDEPSWLEIYAARETNLQGLVIYVSRLDGGDEMRMLIRSSISAEEGAYFVVGNGASEDVDIVSDGFERDLWDDGYISIESCGRQVDEVLYHDLGETGRLSFGDAPDGSANDDESRWCNFVEATPGGPNQTCG